MAEADLIARIDEEKLVPFRFQGWLGRRLTRSFGWRYDFDRGGMGETDRLPEWLLPVRRRAAEFARLPEDGLVQALLTRYDPGAGIDRVAPRPSRLRLRRRHLALRACHHALRRRRPGGFDRTSAHLAPRSIYHLCGDARHGWEHSIAEMDVDRWSITFRSLVASTAADGRGR